MAPPVTCTCGACSKCHRRAYMRDWYDKNRDAAIASAKRSRERRIEDVREYDRLRGRTEERKAEKRERESPRSEGHHEDYSKPLEVRWLCRQHHGEAHRRYP